MIDDTMTPQVTTEDGPSYAGYLLVVLVSFGILGLPDLIQAHWHMIGPAYVRMVGAVARFLRPSDAITVSGNWILSSRVNVSVWAPCIGTDSIKMFSLLFAPLVLMNWKKMRGVLPVVAYLGSLALLALANFGRVLFMLWRPEDTHLGVFHIVTLSVLAVAAIVLTKMSRQAPVQA
jgi:hypothetical protein